MISRQQVGVFIAALLVGSLAIAAASCGGSRAQSDAKANANAAVAPQAVDVTTAPAVSRDLPRFIEATGSLAADVQTDVAPTVGGRVVSVNVDLGSFVQQGQVLVQLDPADARLRLEQSRASLQQAESSVQQAEARLGLTPGQKFDPVRVAEVQAAKTAYDLAEKHLQSFEKLLEPRDVSRSAYHQQNAQPDQPPAQ